MQNPLDTHPRGSRATRALASAALLLLLTAVASCGSATTTTSGAGGQLAPAAPTSTSASPETADTSPEAVIATTASAKPPAPPKPRVVIERRVARERTSVPFRTRNIRTDDLPRGVTRVRQTGTTGVFVKVYRVVTKDGRQVQRVLIHQGWLRRPAARIVWHGTHVDPPAPPVQPASNCDPNYSGCVPIASDVDCAGGSGNGPAYVSGPVQVIGSDIYGLDSDDDGYGCE